MKKNKPASPALIRRLGIRSRVMLYLVLFVALVIMLLWLFQIVLLNDFYRYHRTGQITDAANAIINNIDNENLSVLVDHLSTQNDVCILVLNERHKPLLSSEDTRFCLIHRMSSRDLDWWCDMIPKNGDALVELFNIQPFRNDRYNNRFFRGNIPQFPNGEHQSLLYARRIDLPGGESGYLLLNTLITPLDYTVSTLRAQLLWITLAVLLGALVLATVISYHVSRPIIETNAAAKALSRGQFDAPHHGSNYREIAELNSTLARAAHDLNQVERLQHELIANISHDLRTPLTMIGGYAEVMRDIPGENTPENMQIIIDETSRLSTLVEEVMDFSRLQAGSLPMNCQPFDLTASIQEIVGRIGKLVSKDGYSIVFEPACSLSVTADEQRIGQVVYNLIGNALTYTGDDKQVFVTQETHEQHVRIAIRDTGKGISQEDLPLIWKRYYRTKESHKRAVIGSGLGLSIVQGILEQHKAPYGVESTPEEGTIFWFELPVHQG